MYGAEEYTDGVNYNAKHNHVAFMHRISACEPGAGFIQLLTKT